MMIGFVGFAGAQSAPQKPVSISGWPVFEWEFVASGLSGNRYDVQAQAVFTHSSGLQRTSALYYDSGDSFKVRFFAEQAGSWTMSTSSNVPALNNQSASFTVDANQLNRGRIASQGDRWSWSQGGTFVPQLVMYDTPSTMPTSDSALQADMSEFFDRHGFNGFNVNVECRWFDVSSARCDGSDQNPDVRTFERLERLIRLAYERGAMVHLWFWGDAGRGWTPVSLPGGINGTVDQRLQRYIAARLGPLPGWSANYGFDLWEWVSGSQLAQWHSNMQNHSGWPLMLGGRWQKNELTQATEQLDYSSYEQHRPDYAKYVQTISARPNKPSFSEDRFRIRNGAHPYKDYTFEMTRRGLWHSAMAGGVANIWGDLSNGSSNRSKSYAQPEQLATYARVINSVFNQLSARCPEIASICLRNGASNKVLVYKENADNITMTLSGDNVPAIAIDAAREYSRLQVSLIRSGNSLSWQAPYRSDWVIAVGLDGSL